MRSAAKRSGKICLGDYNNDRKRSRSNGSEADSSSGGSEPGAIIDELEDNLKLRRSALKPIQLSHPPSPALGDLSARLLNSSLHNKPRLVRSRSSVSRSSSDSSSSTSLRTSRNDSSVQVKVIDISSDSDGDEMENKENSPDSTTSSDLDRTRTRKSVNGLIREPERKPEPLPEADTAVTPTVDDVEDVTSHYIEYGDPDSDQWPTKKNKQYVVEFICGLDAGTYYVKWLDWSPLTNTWEPPQHLLGCPDMIKSFHERMIIQHSILCKISNEKRLRELGMKPFSFTKENTVYKGSKTYWKTRHIETEWNGQLEKRGQAKLLIEMWLMEGSSAAYYNHSYTSLKSFEFNSDYSMKYVEEELNSIEERELDTIGCECTGTCNTAPCCGTGSPAYDKNGCLSLPAVCKRKPEVQECIDCCACDPATCTQRVVQRGRQVVVVLFRDPQKGWTLRAGEDIKKGKLVSVYSGEVLTQASAYARKSSTYQFEFTKFGRDLPFVVDAAEWGNESRFMSHSCNGNCLSLEVFVNKYGSRCPAIGIFAARDIEMGEELSFDYFFSKTKEDIAKMLNSKSKKGIACLCGSKKCRGFIP